MTTKILALTDALGNLVRFVLLPGQRFDTVGVPPLIEGLAFDALIADKAFDSNAIIADLDARGAKVVISQHPRRAKPLTRDQRAGQIAGEIGCAKVNRLRRTEPFCGDQSRDQRGVGEACQPEPDKRSAQARRRGEPGGPISFR